MINVKTLTKISCAIAAGFLLIGCGVEYRGESETIEVSNEIDLGETFSDLIQKVLELGRDSKTTEENEENKNKTTPISFQKLIEYLPKSNRGWSKEEPEGKTVSFRDYSVSQVKQKYFKNDSSITVSIFDWQFNSALYLPFLLSTEFSQESTESYSKGVKIDNIPGRESYNYESKNGSLNLLVERRFFVQIEGNNIESKELREWWDKIDSQSLVEASNQSPHSRTSPQGR